MWNLSKFQILVMTVMVMFGGCLGEHKQTIVRIDGVKDDNAANASITKWTAWSQCVACRQQRAKITLFNEDIALRQLEERPCRRHPYCRREPRKRMHIVEFTKQSKKYIEYDERNHVSPPHRKRARVWSKWSAWARCDRDCKTHRYKVCKKPGRCLKAKKYETAHCYVSATYCEQHVNSIISNMLPFSKNNPRWRLTSTTTTTAAPPVSRMLMPATRPKRKHVCGRLASNYLKIKGGRDAMGNTWPWHGALVNRDNSAFCGGTLIAPRWVLTAGHCVRASHLRVRFNYSNPQEIPVIWARRHGRFNQSNIDNDIGLLYLSRPAGGIPHACLPETQPTRGELCTILGYGSLNEHDPRGHHTLQEAKVPIVANGTCIRALKDFYLSRNMFCAGYNDGSVDTCQGDSGGGLMCRATRFVGRRAYLAYTVQGITSFGDGCGKPGRYGIYTNVVNYIDWITYTINEKRIRARSRTRNYSH